MTPREELIQTIQTAPDDVISALLETLKKLRDQSVTVSESGKEDPVTERLYRKTAFWLQRRVGSASLIQLPLLNR